MEVGACGGWRGGEGILCDLYQNTLYSANFVLIPTISYSRFVEVTCHCHLLSLGGKQVKKKKSVKDAVEKRSMKEIGKRLL